MKSLDYEEIQWLMTEVTGDVCFLSHGQARTVAHHADWPWGKNELLSVSGAEERYRCHHARVAAAEDPTKYVCLDCGAITERSV